MSAEQLVVLALLVAAFAAGWFARGGRGGERSEDSEEGGEGEVARVTPPLPAVPPAGVGAPAVATPRGELADHPEPVRDAARALALAETAFATAVDRWLDERDEITPAGRAAVGELERAVQRLDHAAGRVDEVDETLGDAAYDAVDALREAVRHLGAFREGRSLDAGTSRELDRIEDEVARARAAYGAEPA